ncbi:peptidoglycan-recognition protein LA-like isoform X5 [Schistocerca serialis cubense]|uniref:peptidoglycan-recognition protein LA-like isoform X5 n=1 Tax=Schistocerca serialis cubense TaxID=2023355 RepID=UPI00214F1D21|nr:peptidoglycan-recognition protein LA-like isoform X5 [Schistocerca serialis cubense]
MLDGDHRAADGGGRRETEGDGGDVASAASSEAAGTAAAARTEAAVEDVSDSDSDSFSWTSSVAGESLADDAVPANALAAVGVDQGGVVPFGLADPRRHLSPGPTFGNVAVANSTDVQFGNKTFFNGPVTIKQVVYAKDVEGAAATAVPAAGTGASVAHVDPAAPDKTAVVAEGVRLKVLQPIVANGKAARANGEGEGVRRSWWRRLWKTTRERNMALCGAAAALLLVGGIMSVASALIRDFNRASYKPSVPELPKPWETAETNVTLSGKLYIVPRRDWLAMPRLDPPDYLHPPVPYVIISHSATEGCDTQAACTQMVRFIQTFHMESRHWSDVGYNFMVGGDGYAYEGRGWTVVGAHTYGYNNRSIGLNMIGTFIKVLPSEAQLVALRQLIELGVQEGYVAENYKLLAHRQLSATESPGTRLYEELKTWPHWSQTP